MESSKKQRVNGISTVDCLRGILAVDHTGILCDQEVLAVQMPVLE